MGLFAIAKMPDYQIKQGDSEQLAFLISDFDLYEYKVRFKGVCPTGTIEKESVGERIGESVTGDVLATEYTNNAQTLTITFSNDEFKSMQGVMKYEVEITFGYLKSTIIKGNLIIEPEIIK